MNVGTLEIQLMANLAQLQQGMNQANTLVAGTMSNIEKAVNMAKAAFAGLAAGLTIDAFAGLIRGAIEAKAGLQDLAEKTGSTVESLSALKAVAKLSETSMDGIGDVINKVSKAMVEARDPASASAKAFKSIGIGIKDIEENMDDPAKMMLVLAQNLDKFKDGAGKTSVQMDIMGKSAASIVPFLKDLADKEKLVGNTTTESAEAADKFEKIMVQMGGKWKGVFSIIANEILPTLNEFFTDMLKGGGIAKTVTEYVKKLADEGKIKEWAESAKGAIDTFMTAIVPAAKVLAAWFALFVGFPAIYQVVATAFLKLYGVIGRFVVGMVAGSASTFTMNTLLFGTSVAANLASGSLTKMALVGNVLFAAFAGWQIGTWLREEFVEARIAGLTFLGLMLKGWENLKYGAEMAWEAIKFAWETSINTMKNLFGEYLAEVAQGLNAIGANAVASQVAGYAESLRQAGASQQTFAQQTASITAAHEKAISAIDDDIVATMAWEIAQDDAAKASKKGTEEAEKKKAALAGSTGASAEAIAAAKKEMDAYNGLISAIRAKIEENRLELIIGENASESQKELIKIEQQLATGKLKLTEAHIAAIKAALLEQEMTESMLKTRTAEKATLDWIIASTKARHAATAALENDYKMYGKSNDEKEIALIALKAEADLEAELERRRQAKIVVTTEMLKQMQLEKDLRVKIMQATSGESKGIAYAEQLAIENKRFIAESIFDEKERAAALLAIDVEIWRKRIEITGEGTEAQKKIQAEFDVWYRNQSIKPQLEAQRKLWDSIESTAHDTFVSIFDSGKSAFDRLRDTLKNGLLDLLYQMTVRKWILSIGAAVTGGTLGAAANAVAGGTGGAGGGGGLLGLIGNGASAYNAISGIGMTAGNALVSAGSLFGSSALSAAGYASAVPGLASFGAGSQAAMLAAQTAEFGAAGLASTASAGATAAGAGSTGLMSGATSALGSIPVVGWIALAAAAAAYFGSGKDRELTGVGLSGQLGTQNITRDVSWTKDGGWFNSDTAGTWKYNLANSSTVVDGRNYTDTASQASDKALLAMITKEYDALKLAAGDYAKALGVSADFLTNLTQDFSIELGTTAEEMQKNIAKLFEKVGNDISADLLEKAGLTSLKKEGETASQTVSRLAADITGANEAMKLLGYQTYKLDENGIKAAESLVTLFGGLQNLQSVTSAYYDRYYSDAEKASLATTTMAAEFKKLGYTLPDSLAQLRAWIEAAKALGTEAGDKTYVSLMQLSGAFAGLTDATSKLNDTASQKAQSLADSKSDYIIKIMEAQGLGQQALNLQRQKEIMLLDAELRPYAEKLQLALEEKDARELATRQAGLAVEILRLEGKETQALALQRKLELAAMEEGLRPQQLRLYALQDEASQLEVLKGHRALDIQLMRALGNEEAALAAERADALKGLDEYSQGVTKQIWAANAASEAIAKAKAEDEAAARAAEQSKQEMQQALQKQADEAKALYDKKINDDRAALQEAYNAESAALQAIIDKMGGFAKAARAMQESLRFGDDSAMTRAQKFAVAQANMPSVMALARTGDTAAIDQLKQYVDLLKASASSSEEYVNGVVKVIAILDGAADTAETQESLAKSQLAMLKNEVDAILGVDKTVVTVALAIAQLNTDLQGGLAGVANAVYGQYQANNKPSVVATTSASTALTPDQIYGGPAGNGVNQLKFMADIKLNNERTGVVQDYIAEAYDREARGNPSDHGYFKDLSEKYYGQGAFERIARELGIFAPAGFANGSMLPSYDVGTNYVPKDMLAMIHEGEAIIPKAYNPSAMQADNLRTQALEQMVENLTGEIQGLRIEARAIAVSNAKMEAMQRRTMAPQGDAQSTREVPA